MKRGTLAGIVGVLLALLSPVALASDDPRDWLERMSAAMSQMDYQGTFVYVQGDDVATMRITHVTEGGVTRERLVSMSGTPREVVRDARGVRWFAGEQRGALEDPAIDRPVFFDLPLNDVAQASDSYRFRLRGNDRIAGHPARRLDIEPRDRFRYGYTLWLEAESGLLLQWRLTDRKDETLARLMFTDLKIGSEINLAELHPSNRHRESATLRTGLPPEGRTARHPPAWAPVRLPPGFQLASHRVPDDTSAPFEHLVYTDGIAMVSVYIESLQRKSSVAEGTTRMGTTHAYFGAVGDSFVTVVGDVPEETVRLIGEAIRPVEP